IPDEALSVEYVEIEAVLPATQVLLGVKSLRALVVIDCVSENGIALAGNNDASIVPPSATLPHRRYVKLECSGEVKCVAIHGNLVIVAFCGQFECLVEGCSFGHC